MRSIVTGLVLIMVLALLTLEVSVSSPSSVARKGAVKPDTKPAVYVVGNVQKPGLITLVEGMTVRDAIIHAGNPTVNADKEDKAEVCMRRLGQKDPICMNYALVMEGDPTVNIALKHGDLLYVNTKEPRFAVLGWVKKPGFYPLKGTLTISDALSIAGGPVVKDHVSQADLSNVTVIHDSLDNTGKLGKKDNVDLSAILQGRASDMEVRPGDVIYVPQHARKGVPLRDPLPPNIAVSGKK